MSENPTDAFARVKPVSSPTGRRRSDGAGDEPIEPGDLPREGG